MQQEDAHRAAPQEPGEPSRDRAGQGDAEAEREGQSGRHPEREGAADETQVAVRQQVLGIAGRVGFVLAAEHPADMRVGEPAQFAAPSRRMVDVRAVRVAGLVRETVVLAVGGDPVVQPALDRHRAEHGQQHSHRARGLEAAVGEQPVEADGDAQPGERVRDRQHEQVVPVQAPAPSHPSGDTERGRRHDEEDRAHDMLGRVVLDRNHVRGSANGIRIGENQRVGHVDLRGSGPSEVRSCCRPDVG